MAALKDKIPAFVDIFRSITKEELEKSGRGRDDLYGYFDSLLNQPHLLRLTKMLQAYGRYFHSSRISAAIKCTPQLQIDHLGTWCSFVIAEDAKEIITLLCSLIHKSTAKVLN